MNKKSRQQSLTGYINWVLPPLCTCHVIYHVTWRQPMKWLAVWNATSLDKPIGKANESLTFADWKRDLSSGQLFPWLRCFQGYDGIRQFTSCNADHNASVSNASLACSVSNSPRSNARPESRFVPEESKENNGKLINNNNNKRNIYKG